MLVRSLPGLAVTVSEAVRALRRYGGSFARARQFIERNASRDHRGRIISRIEQRLGPFPSEETMRKRQRTTNDQVPVGNRLAGRVIQIGDKASYTVSKSRHKAVNGKVKSLSALVMRNALYDNVFRWQSIKPYVTGQEKREIRSQLLDVWSCRQTSSPYYPAEIYLPMYAFDLGTIPVNNAIVTPVTKTGWGDESIPFYRLFKKVDDGVAAAGLGDSLKGNVINYQWCPINGMNNGPSSAYGYESPSYIYGKSNYLWNPEITSGGAWNADTVKNKYTAVELLLHCSKKMHCKVHVSVVTFKNFCGPSRLFCENQVLNHTANMATVNPDAVSTTTYEQSQNDVFWEAFWDQRITHPLSKYNIPNKHQQIVFLSDDVININPEDVTSDVPFTHKKEIIISDGGVQVLRTSKTADETVSNDYGQQPPLVDDYAVGVTNNYTSFRWSYGFNSIKKDSTTVELYDPATRDTNKWLLIWMESPISNTNMATVGDIFRPDRPELVNKWIVEGAGSTPFDNYDCCSFDIKVRRAFTVVPTIH